MNVNLLKSRRGIAMELAIMVLLITFALGTLLVSAAMVQVSQKNSTQSVMEENVALEQLGCDFCAAVKAGQDMTEWAQSVNDYTVAVAALGDGSLEMRAFADGKLKTIILLTPQESVYRVAQWRIY